MCTMNWNYRNLHMLIKKNPTDRETQPIHFRLIKEQCSYMIEFLELWVTPTVVCNIVYSYVFRVSKVWFGSLKTGYFSSNSLD